MKNKSPDLWLLFYLVSRCVLLISALGLSGFFLGQAINFLHGGKIAFSRDDLYFFVKMGCGVGCVLGIGLWVMAKINFFFKNKK